MTAPSDTIAPAAPHPRLDDPPQPQHSITLTTTVSGTTISISAPAGNGGTSLPVDQAATRFNFTLQDSSGQNVQFSSLDTADGITTCPPTGSGNKSGQIVGITMNNNNNNHQPNTAGFTDNNNNPATNGPLDVSYQWNFTCNSGYTVQPFDPIISNGGKSGPM
jgi:hypothetical protein